MTPITVTLLGAPVPFARMRISATGGHYIPQKQRATMAMLRILAQREIGYGNKPFDIPIRLDLVAEFPIPASYSKKRRRLAILGQILPSKKPDLDNLMKLCTDAFSQVLYRDDALICQVTMAKIYGEQPRLTVTVSPCLSPSTSASN